LVVFIRSKKDLSSKFLGGLFFSVAVWIFCLLFADTLKDKEVVLTWTKLAIIGPSFIPFFILLLSFVFPFQEKAFKLTLPKILLLLVPAMVIVLLSPTQWNVIDVTVESWGANVDPGPLSYYILFMP